MIFSFLKYVKPIWYFNLKPQIDFGYFPTIQQLEEQGVAYQTDTRYVSQSAKEHDIAWTAFQKGFINKSFNKGINIWDNNSKIPVVDQYVFIRKNFSTLWVIYIVFLRIVTFHNPFIELYCFFKTIGIKRISISKPILYPQYQSFKSNLLQQNPFISVIIPTLNRYEYLKDVFTDLEHQTYTNFEVIVVDQTDNFNEEIYKNRNLKLTYWFQPEKALWKARNDAVKYSKADYVLLYDDDSRVDNDWIEQHIKVLDFFNADLSSGVSISKIGDKVPLHYSFFRWSEQLDTGNVLIKKSVFEKIGYFDRQFEKQRMGDGEFGLRAYRNGFKNISNCKAKRLHLKVGVGGLRQMGSWDGWRPKSYLDPRPVPSVLYMSRKYFGDKLAVLDIISSVVPSIIPYKYKKSKLLKVLSFAVLPIIAPFVLFQVYKSWKLATIKLNEGSKID